MASKTLCGWRDAFDREFGLNIADWDTYTADSLRMWLSGYLSHDVALDAAQRICRVISENPDWLGNRSWSELRDAA